MNLSRRFFLRHKMAFVLANGLLGTYLTQFSNIFSKPALTTVKTIFPKKMDFNEFVQEQNTFVNIKALDTLLENFKASGKVIGTPEFQFYGTYSLWKIQFAQLEHYREWDRFITQHQLVKDHIWSKLGYKLQVSTSIS